MTRPKVAILGGGVAGLSAAHELAERGCAVEVFERCLLAGGKARSIPVLSAEDDRGGRKSRAVEEAAWKQYSAAQPLSADARRPWVPGEHGFRFFPSFYRHVVDTMSRIPTGTAGFVSDNLVDTTRVLLSRFDRPGMELPVRFPRTLAGIQTVLDALGALVCGHAGVPLDEFAFFASRIWQVMTSCAERRLRQYESIPWWQFIDASTKSQGYQRLLGYGITRSLVAAQADKASTKTIGDIFLQLLFGIADPQTTTSDRVLCGPTNHVWIAHWLTHIRALGVRYHFDREVVRLEVAHGSIRSATVRAGDGATERITADYYICAMPIERLVPLVSPELIAADPSLANLKALAVNLQWMNGIQFYLKRDVPIVHGHAIFVDAPWALTSVSQAQFWKDIDLSKYGDGTVRGILSVDISDWSKPGLNGKAARDCSRNEVAAEVWNQIKRSLNHAGEILRDDDLHFWYLDPDIRSDPQKPTELADVEPLLVNLVNTWKLRPEAVTAIPNLFLASDYVRTHTDLATMEGANEAARRAVNGVLAHSHCGAPPCQIWPLHEPELLQPLREYDRGRFAAGLPWDSTVSETVVQMITLANRAGREVGAVEALDLARQFLTHTAAQPPTQPAPSADLPTRRPRVRVVPR